MPQMRSTPSLKAMKPSTALCQEAVCSNPVALFRVYGGAVDLYVGHIDLAFRRGRLAPGLGEPTGDLKHPILALAWIVELLLKNRVDLQARQVHHDQAVVEGLHIEGLRVGHFARQLISRGFVEEDVGADSAGVMKATTALSLQEVA